MKIQAESAPSPANQSPTLRLEWIEAGSLTPNPKNWRRHPEAQKSALKDVINDPNLGWAGALLFNERTKRLIDGHARREVVPPDTLVPVLIGSWSEEAEKKILATLDPLAGLALSDPEALLALLGEVEFDSDALKTLEASLRDQVDDFLRSQSDVNVIEDEPPAPPDKATTQRGDLWVLGNHRLLCGDSASTDDLDRLLDGAHVHLCNCDPPYNVNVEPRSNNARAAGSKALPALAKKKAHLQGFDDARQGKPKPTTARLRAKDRVLTNDFMSREDFDKVLLAWFGNMARALVPGGAFYIWGGFANWANYCQALEACGLYFSQGITWVKDHPVLGRKDFMNDCEHAWYGWKEGAGHKFYGPNNARNVWPIKKVNPQSMIHLTEKPVELAARAMQYSSRPGENVLDLFGGSGSTLIAAEQMGRRAFLMELDPLYCDVICTRWARFAHKQPINAATGKSFADSGEPRDAQ